MLRMIATNIQIVDIGDLTKHDFPWYVSQVHSQSAHYGQAALTALLEDLLWVLRGVEEALAEAHEVSPVLDNGVINAAALRTL